MTLLQTTLNNFSLIAAQAQILDPVTPLSSYTGTMDWAVVNLLIVVICLIAALISFFRFFLLPKQKVSIEANREKVDISQLAETSTTKRKPHTNSENYRSLLWRILALLIAVSVLFAFLLTEDIDVRLVLVDSWTPVMLVLLTAQSIVMYAAAATYHTDQEEDSLLPAGDIRRRIKVHYE